MYYFLRRGKLHNLKSKENTKFGNSEQSFETKFSPNVISIESIQYFRYPISFIRTKIHQNVKDRRDIICKTHSSLYIMRPQKK